jgi:hypothetical protein
VVVVVVGVVGVGGVWVVVQHDGLVAGGIGIWLETDLGVPPAAVLRCDPTAAVDLDGVLTTVVGIDERLLLNEQDPVVA